MHFHNFALNYKKKQTKKHQTRTKRSILMDEYSLRLFKLLKQPHKLIITKAKQPCIIYCRFHFLKESLTASQKFKSWSMKGLMISATVLSGPRIAVSKSKFFDCSEEALRKLISSIYFDKKMIENDKWMFLQRKNSGMFFIRSANN